MNFIELNGTVLRYELSGKGEETIVLLHQMMGVLESWDWVLPKLRERRRVLRYDTRGAGMSEKLRGTAPIDTMTADLEALLVALGIQGPVAVAGVAVGALIAMRFAAHYAERVKALIAMSPATGIPQERRAATMSLADEIEGKGMRAFADDMMDRQYPPSLRGDLERFEAMRCQFLSNDPGSVAAIYRMLACVDMTDDFRRIDLFRPPAGVQAVARSLPNARFETIEAGHVMQIQAPERVAAAINGFLADVAAGRFTKTAGSTAP
jgi:pimeloyl-ACP methyl ester carboxylesterase